MTMPKDTALKPRLFLRPSQLGVLGLLLFGCSASTDSTSPELIDESQWVAVARIVSFDENARSDLMAIVGIEGIDYWVSKTMDYPVLMVRRADALKTIDLLNKNQSTLRNVVVIQ